MTMLSARASYRSAISISVVLASGSTIWLANDHASSALSCQYLARKKVPFSAFDT